MEWYVTAMEEIKRRRGTKKERAILDLWERLGNERKLDSEACKYITESLLEIYPRLDFNQKHAALEAFLKIGDGNAIKNTIFDYFGGDIQGIYKIGVQAIKLSLCNERA